MERETPKSGRHPSVLSYGRRQFIFLLTVLSFAVTAAVVRCQSVSTSPDFLSIDCGKADENYSYNDTDTGLFYTSDHQYVSTGEIHTVSSTYQKTVYYTQAYDLRSFPNGTRNCYNLPVKPNRKYLLRASFLYGNYDGKNITPQFALHVGVNHWMSVALTNAAYNSIHDFIFVGGVRGSMNVCLVNTGGGTPFISALELRPLSDEIYPQASATQALANLARDNYGGMLKIRYSTDIYDRIWFPNNSGDWVVVTTSSPVQTEPSYQTPSDVLRAAVLPKTGSTLSVYCTVPTDTAVPDQQFYVFFYFAELQQLEANQSRVFDITLNGKPWNSEPVRLTYLKAVTEYSRKPEKVNPLNFVLVQASNSSPPPILNAAEVFSVRDMTGVETSAQDADAMMIIKAVYKLQRNWEGDPCFPNSYIWEGLICSSDESKSPRITALNLASFGLTGNITNAIANLTHLQTLDLSRNSLTGAIPVFLTNLTQLSFLDLSGNRLHGEVPQALLDRSAAGKLTLKIDTSADSCNGSTSCDNKKSKTKAVAAIAASVGSILVLALIIVVMIWMKKKRTGRLEKLNRGNNSGSQKIHKSSSFKLESMHFENKRFTYSDLKRITKNFQKEIGRGGFGPVYYGVLDNNVEVAVKLLSESSSQGPKEFQNEALLLTRIHHKNLVPFVGYCNENMNNLALLYEYMAEGSLQDHLHGRGNQVNNSLNWMARLRIAVDAAQGIEYLHHSCKPAIVHRDVKTNNILLNQIFEAKIADFGISKIFENEDCTHILTTVIGTPGYVDPEYYITNKLTEKSDVYSFGVVLLELITGLPAIIKTKEKINLVQWVQNEFVKGNIEEIVDKRIHGEYHINSVLKAIETALACTEPHSIKRLNMSEVLCLLKDCLQLETKKVSSQSTSQFTTDTNSDTTVKLLATEFYTMSNQSTR